MEDRHCFRRNPVLFNEMRNSAEASFEVRKNTIRKEKIAARKSIPASERRLFDAKINDSLRQLISDCGSFRVLVGYLTDGSEPDLSPVMREALAAGKTLLLPRFRDADHYDLAPAVSLTFSDSKFGIPEPPACVPAASDDLLTDAVWLVPGVAFDDSGVRIGRGKGVYDRLLSRAEAKRTIGIFYHCQKCDSAPRAPHDRSLDWIVTEQTCFRPAISMSK